MNLIIEILKAIVLGVVEGITEWLPISSTGHMILVDEFLHLNVTPQFKEMFLVVIQLGAILAVVVLYWHKLWPFGIENKRIVPKKDIWQMWFKVLVSCVPAAVVGVLFDDKLNALFYTLHAVVRPNGVYVIKQQHLKYLVAGRHERHGHKVVHLKAQVVVLFGKRLDERFARADNLCICRADPQHVRVAGRQKRLDLIIVIPRYNVGGKLQQSLCSHSAPRKKRLIYRKTSCIY